MDWKVLAVSIPLLFATYQTLTKFLPKDVSVFLVSAYASFVGFLIMLTIHMLVSSNKSLTLDSKSFLLSLGIGALISLGNYGIIKAYSLGAPQSIFTLIFYITLIVYGILFGFIIWHEKMSIYQIAGMGLSVIGLWMVVYFKK